MNSYLVYRASFYLMLIVATMALSGDTPEGQFARLLYPVAVTVAGIVAFFTVDLHRRLGPAAATGQLRWPSRPWSCSTSSTRSTRPR